MTAAPSTSPTPPRRRVPVVLYAHPFEVALGISFVLAGIRATEVLDFQAFPLDRKIVDVVLTGYIVAGVIGGIGVLIGLAIRVQPFGRTLEQAALCLVAGAWSAYGLNLILLPGTAGVATGAMHIVIAAACLLRAVAIYKTARVILATYRHANNDADALRRLIDGRPPA